MFRPRMPIHPALSGECGSSMRSRMSTEVPARPSSQARKRPTGPAPAMITSWGISLFAMASGAGPPLGHEDEEVSGDGLGVKLAHHKRDLAAMVGGVVGKMVHLVREGFFDQARGKHSGEKVVGDAIEECDLQLLDFSPLRLRGCEVGKSLRIEYSVALLSHVYEDTGVVRWSAPIGEPDPLGGEDVNEHAADGGKAASEVARELLGGEGGGRLQHAMVGPAVVLVELPDIVGGHESEGYLALAGGTRPFMRR